MNPVYDHIVALVFIGVMFVWAVSVIPQMSFNNIQSVNQQQLKNTELNVFDYMLLNTGSGLSGSTNTTEWGSLNPFDEHKVYGFGLASASESVPFTLDPDKVQRLVPNNPLGNLTYARAKDLLGLEGFDFMFEILPPFNITNSNGAKIDSSHNPLTVTGNTVTCSVKVSYLDGRPIPTAKTNATIIYTKGSTFYPFTTCTNSTDEMGIALNQATLSVSDPESIMVILRVTVADVATLVVNFGRNNNSVLDVNMVGDDVILTEPKIPSNAAVWLESMSYYSSDGSVSYFYTGGTNDDKINTGGGLFELWSQTFNGLKSMDPVFLILELSAVENNNGHGRREIVIAGPYQNFLGYTVFQYGSQNIANRPIVTSQRSVIISGMTYTAQLTLWKN